MCRLSPNVPYLYPGGNQRTAGLQKNDGKKKCASRILHGHGLSTAIDSSGHGLSSAVDSSGHGLFTAVDSSGHGLFKAVDSMVCP